MNEKTRVKLDCGFVKSIDKPYIENLVPFYGKVKGQSIILQQIPLVKSRDLILDKDSLLYPLYPYQEVYHLKKYNKQMINYCNFMKYVLQEVEDTQENMFVVVEPEELQELYNDDGLASLVNNYLITRRIRKREKK